jgi:hypothetical protein
LTLVLACLAISTALASPVLAQVEYDSAGVTVVRNPAAAQAASSWRVGPEPLLEIGGAVDDARYQLFHVSDAARLSDGRIVVANAGNFELRFYDGRGAYVSAAGREGGGPGEFRSIDGLEVGEGDSIYVFDGRSQRLSIFDARGQLIRDLPVPPSTAPLAYVGRFADGGWYARDRDESVPAPFGEIRRDTARYIGLDAALEKHTSFAALPGTMTGGSDRFGYRTAPFSPFPTQDVLGNCLYVVTGDDFDVRIFSSKGELLRLVRNGGEREPLTEAHRTAWIDALFFAATQIPESARPQRRRQLEEFPTPTELPVYNDVVVDAHAYIWLQEYTPVPRPGLWWSGPGRGWIVLDATGRLLGRVEMPVALEVYEIGPDYILGLWRDEIGEEFVRVYGLHAERDPQARAPLQCSESRRP